MTRKSGVKNGFAVAFTLIVGVAAVGVCGFLLYLFLTFDNFPLLLMIIVCALSGIMAIAAFSIMVIKIRDLLD